MKNKGEGRNQDDDDRKGELDTGARAKRRRGKKKNGVSPKREVKN